jgi:hypothetical protein
MILERIERRFRGRQHLDVESLEESPRQVLWTAKTICNSIVDPVRRLEGESLGNAEDLSQCVRKPNP